MFFSYSSAVLSVLVVLMVVVGIVEVGATAGGGKSPVLVVPGLFSSVLEANIHDGADMPVGCSAWKNAQWRHLWVDISVFPFSFSCWKAATKLNYSPATLTSTPPDGISTRVMEDSITATSCVDPTMCGTTAYLKGFFTFMNGNGFVIGKEVDAVPYDFRLSPMNHYLPGGLFERLKSRVETMFTAAKNSKVTLVGHSLGGPLCALFFNTFVNQTWKDAHVERFISVGGMYAGAPWALKALISGDTKDIPLPSSSVKSVFRTFASLAMIVPMDRNGVSKWGDTVVAEVGTRTYTAAHLREILTGFEIPFAKQLDSLRGVDVQRAPQIATHCLISKSHSTPEKISYSDGEDNFPTVSQGQGDGIVLLRSLEVCSEWRRFQANYTVDTHEFASDHYNLMVKDTNVWNYIYARTVSNTP